MQNLMTWIMACVIVGVACIAMAQADEAKPILTFGVIADIQYADKPDGGRNGMRAYRSSLQRLSASVADFNERSPAFVVQVGDMIDSDLRNARTARDNATEAMRKDIRAVLTETAKLTMPLYHVVGNHCFDLGLPYLKEQLGRENLYYDFVHPDAKGWRFVVTNGMDPRRMIGRTQAQWLRDTLAKAAENGERVIGFNHFTLVAEAAPNHDRLGNGDEIRRIIEDAGNVVAWFSGHDHTGGYALQNGIHYITLQGMVEAANKNAYGYVELHDDRIKIIGVGKVPNRELALTAVPPLAPAALTYPIVDTGQDRYYDHTRAIAAPQAGQPYYGQDAHYAGHAPAYRDNGDGTVTDLVTGLMWIAERGEKVTWQQARDGAEACRIGGHDDWRMPTIKELYSLINFNGGFHRSPEQSRPYIDTRYFGFAYGDTAQGERAIDCQDWSATAYTQKAMNGQDVVFGVNFADGRIKGYPVTRGRGNQAQPNRLYVRYVRGNTQYGHNQFHDNDDGTITDRATGLTWTQADSGRGMDWQQALAYAENLSLGGHDDWRLPNAKELQSIVDYTKVPAMNAMFTITRMADGEYPFYWTSTTHLDGPPERAGREAVYVAIGRATGWMSAPPGRDGVQLLDVHGAGAQRSDPKSGDPAAFPQGRGPQGDVVRIHNFVLCVRNTDPVATPK